MTETVAPTYAPPAEPQITSEEKTLAIIAHLGTPVGLLISAGTLSWLPALIIYLMKKDSSKFVRNAGAGALNFAITSLIIGTVASALISLCIALFFLIVPIIIFAAVAIALGVWVVLMFVFGILGAIAANRGEEYKYPLTLNLVK